MAVYRKPARQRFILLIVTLLAVTVITLDQRGQASGIVDRVRDGAHDVFAPVQSAVGRPARAVRSRSPNPFQNAGRPVMRTYERNDCG